MVADADASGSVVSGIVICFVVFLTKLNHFFSTIIIEPFVFFIILLERFGNNGIKNRRKHYGKKI